MSCFVRLRGLPWSVTHQEILDFLENVNVVNGTKGISMVLSRFDGKNTGEAFVELESEEDEKEAFKLNKNTIGHRYIEVFSATNEEAEHALKNPGSNASNVVKLRGLPYDITDDMIEEFFSGLNIKRNGILTVMDRRGRASGEAFVQFENGDDTEQALLRNREKIGHRYIEIFRSSLVEMRRHSNNRPAPYDIKDRGGFRNNRDDFGGNNMNNMRDSGFGNNNRNGFGGGGNKPMGMNNSSGNGLNLSGFGMFGGLGGYNNGNNNSGSNFDRPMNSNYNNMGMSNNSSGGGGGGGGNREQGFNQGGGSIWSSNDMNKNMRGLNDNMGQSFGGNRGFNNDNGGGNNMNNSFDRGNNRMSMMGGGGGGGNGGGMGGNNMGNKNNFGNNRGFQNNDNDNDNDNLFCVHMRGLPYNTFENEVCKFFQPVRPDNVKIIFNNKGLHSGSADAYFSSYDDSQLAMKKHKEQIGNRYIELFFDGKTNGNRSGNFRQNNQNF